MVALAGIVLASCSKKDDTPYPSIISDYVTVVGDDQGKVQYIIIDDGTQYSVDNEITGMRRGATARAVCGYVHTEQGHVRVYNILGIPLLGCIPDTVPPRMDPTGIASVWASGGYVNLHLLPKTQGGLQKWGFINDSVTTNAQGGKTYHLSLFHDQGEDPVSYTGHLYASIQADSVADTRQAGDSLVLYINTFDNLRSWQFPLPASAQ